MGDTDRLGAFENVRAKSLEIRARSLRIRLDSVQMLCEMAESGIRYFSLRGSFESLEKARVALDGIRHQFEDPYFLSGGDAAEIQGRITDAEARLVRVSQRLRVAKEGLKAR